MSKRRATKARYVQSTTLEIYESEIGHPTSSAFIDTLSSDGRRIKRVEQFVVVPPSPLVSTVPAAAPDPSQCDVDILAWDPQPSPTDSDSQDNKREKRKNPYFLTTVRLSCLCSLPVLTLLAGARRISYRLDTATGKVSTGAASVRRIARV